MSSALSRIRQLLLSAHDARAILQHVAQFLVNDYFADRAVVSYQLSGKLETVELTGIEQISKEAPLFALQNGRLSFQGQHYNTTVCISNTATSRLYGSLEHILRERGVRSFAAIPIYSGAEISGVIEIHYFQLYQRWQRSDLERFDHLADLCGWSLNALTPLNDKARAPSEPQVPQFDVQKKRIEALYELSHTLTIDVDPAIIALKGLKSLIRATDCAAGVCVFVDAHDKKLDIVAAEGLSARYIEGLARIVNDKTLLLSAVESRQGFRSANLQSDSRAAQAIASQEGLRSAVIVPLIYEEHVYGALALFQRSEVEFSTDDYDLVRAAAQQICLIARQAEFFSTERRNAQSLRALYQLTHELSKHFSAQEVAEHAFPIIQEQIPCKRMWLATLNEQNTHLVGQAGFGPGLRRRIVKVQIQRSQPHQYLDRAIESRAPVVIPRGSTMECAGLRMVVKRLDLGTFIILPLVSLGQVVGVLLVEPNQTSSAVIEEQMALLWRMSVEIATVILARRFESRMASDDKMRTAGLLASGVAHNFNNILQAIMGQSSLIEMQLPKDSPLIKSAQLIVDSAHRGAGLIKQLVACTVGEHQNIEKVDVKKMIDESRDFYRSILGSPIDLAVEVAERIPEILVDYGRLQQTIASILVYAKDAIGERTDGVVELRVGTHEVSLAEQETELLPGSYVEITVKDNGRGLDDEQRARVFEPFYALYNEDSKTQIGNSSALNLSAAYALIRNYGGTMTVISKPNAGAVFSILIPPAGVREQQSKLRTGKSDARALAEEAAVLMFDIDEQVTYSVASLVESWGEGAALIRKRQKLRELLQRKSSPVRIVIFDVDRSSEDIVGFIREIRRVSSVPRILISTFDTRRWSKLLRGIEQLEFLAKPQSLWTLDKVLRKPSITSLAPGLDRQVERINDAAATIRVPADNVFSSRKTYPEQ